MIIDKDKNKKNYNTKIYKKKNEQIQEKNTL